MIARKIKRSLLTLKMIRQIGKLESIVIFNGRYINESDLEHHKAYMDMRKVYVVEQGWLDLDEEDTDEDHYDFSDKTVTVLTVTKENEPKVVCGMRLTSIGSDEVNKSLSFQMLNGEFQMLADNNGTLIEHAKRNYPNWDLTRLITNPEFKEEKSLLNAGLFKLFATAMAVVHEVDRRNNPHEISWFFTTTPEIMRFITKRKIDHEIVVSGKIDDKDEHDSYFIVMKPFKSLQQLNKNNRLLAAVVRRIINNATD